MQVKCADNAVPRQGPDVRPASKSIYPTEYAIAHLLTGFEESSATNLNQHANAAQVPVENATDTLKIFLSQAQTTKITEPPYSE